VVVLTRLGPEIAALYATLFLVAVACFGVVAVMAGPVPTEALGAAVASSAIGIVTGAAEIFGGGIAPILSGAVADRFGIQYVPYIGLVGLCFAVPIGLLLKETAPRARARSGAT
jgi:fucose permease